MIKRIVGFFKKLFGKNAKCSVEQEDPFEWIDRGEKITAEQAPKDFAGVCKPSTPVKQESFQQRHRTKSVSAIAAARRGETVTGYKMPTPGGSDYPATARTNTTVVHVDNSSSDLLLGAAIGYAAASSSDSDPCDSGNSDSVSCGCD